MSSVIVTVRINGDEFKYWESVTINKSIESLADSFDLSLTDTDEINLNGNDEIKIYYDDILILTGYIDKISRSLSSTDRSYSASGRSRPADLVDCSKIDPPFSFKNMRINDVAEIIARDFGISVESISLTRPIRSMTIDQGESYFDFLDRYARKEKVFLNSTPEGNIKIVKVGYDRKYFTGLDSNVNVLSYSTEKSFDKKFSKYIVKGQYGKKQAQVKSTSVDPDVTRFRPINIVSSEKLTLAEARNRADWERQIRNARSESLTVDVQGWDIENQLFEINTIIIFDLKEYLITDINFKQDSGGTSTQMTLIDPKVYLL